jgi:hypothetical protein
MTTITIEAPSFVKESMIFTTERDMFNRYLSLMDEVDFRQETELSEQLTKDILNNKTKDILYTNI